MQMFSSQKSKKALERYRSISQRAAKRGLRQGLRMEKLDQRVVLTGVTAVAVNDLYEATMDEPLQVEVAGVLANDTDAEGDTLSALEFSGPKHGELTLNEDGSFLYEPDPGFSGVDGFTYQANDGSSLSPLAAVTINVIDDSVPPVGENDYYAMDEDGVLEVLAEEGVLANDSDENGDTLTAALMTPAEHGTLTLMDDGSFTYTPDPDFHGTDAFTYFAYDGELASELVVVEIEVQPINDSPVGQGESFTIAEDTALEITAPEEGLLANDTDVDGDTLTAIADSMPAHGQLELNADGTFTYTPDADFHGSDSFSYRVSDGTLESELVTVSIEVTAVHDPSIANNDFFTMQEDGVLSVTDDSLISNDQIGDVESWTIELVDAPEHGTVQLNADGTFEFTPNPDFNGTDAFTYRINDGVQASELAVVEISVLAVNDAPVAEDDSFSVDMNATLTISPEELMSNDSDVDGDDLTLTLLTPPTNGTVELTEEGDFVYTPNVGYFGEDVFEYELSDGSTTTTAQVSVTVNQGDTPTSTSARNEVYTATSGETLTVESDAGLLANETVGEGETLEAVLYRGPQHGEIVFNADGSFQYTPEAGFEGVDSIMYRTASSTGVESQLGVATLIVQPAAASVAMGESDNANSDNANSDEGADGVSEDLSTEIAMAVSASIVAEVETDTENSVKSEVESELDSDGDTETDSEGGDTESSADQDSTSEDGDTSDDGMNNDCRDEVFAELDDFWLSLRRLIS